MAVSDDRKYTKEFVVSLLESVKGKTLGEVDSSNQFARTIDNEKITGLAGDVIEQSVFRYKRDSKQECDINIDGLLTELKTTGVRVPIGDLERTKGLTGAAYNVFLGAKEGISITGVTFEPTFQSVFETSHFWEKAQRLLLVFYEYDSYSVVPASAYANFRIVDYCFNTFSDNDKSLLESDWNVVRDHLKSVYDAYPDAAERNAHLVGFTHLLRKDMLVMELVPSFKKRATGSYQKPRYRLKQTFVDYIVRGHFKSRLEYEVSLREGFNSFAQLDSRCHGFTQQYRGMTLLELKSALVIETDVRTKDFGAKCVLKMFDADCKRLNQIADFNKAGIICKTITVTPKGGRTEDMKLRSVNFDEWADRNSDFEDSDVFCYFFEHSFLCPIFCEHDNTDPSKTTFEGFKRFVFDDDFIENEVRRTWDDSRALIHENKLEWEYLYDRDGNKRVNGHGAYMGAPNLPKSSDYQVFFRGGANISDEAARTECVNGIRMLPQFFWLKGSFIANKLQEIDYL